MRCNTPSACGEAIVLPLLARTWPLVHGQTLIPTHTIQWTKWYGDRFEARLGTRLALGVP